MDNWRRYFIDKLTLRGQFIVDKEFEKGQTSFVMFKSTDTGRQTIIKLGILSNGDLITLEFINPLTPGFNKQQEQEYFYKFDFYSDKNYGGPGVEFNDNNTAHFDKFLKEGLKGREVQYFKNGRIIQSEIFQYYGTNEDISYGTTITMEKLSFLEKAKILVKRKERFYDTKTEVQLSEVFSGV